MFVNVVILSCISFCSHQHPDYLVNTMREAHIFKILGHAVDKPGNIVKFLSFALSMEVKAKVVHTRGSKIKHQLFKRLANNLRRDSGFVSSISYRFSSRLIDEVYNAGWTILLNQPENMLLAHLGATLLWLGQHRSDLSLQLRWRLPPKYWY